MPGATNLARRRPSKARRGRGEGSVYERQDGRWVAVLSAGIDPRTGRRKRYVAYANTKDAALKKLDLLRRKYGIRNVSDPTLREFLNTWLHDRDAHLAGASYDLYERLIDVIAKDLGDVRLSALRAEQIRRWASAQKSVMRQRALRLLRQALNQAEADDLVIKNPAQHVRVAASQKRERRVLSPADVNAYLDACAGDRFEPLVIMALFTAMREGELLGLQWPDIDWEEKVVSVRQALKRKRGGKYTVGDPKTAKSRRPIVLPDFVIDALQRHRERMMAEGHGSPYVFCSHVGTTMNPSNVRNRFHYPTLQRPRICQECGAGWLRHPLERCPACDSERSRAALPRVTFHDLRHTAATLLAHVGVHPRVTQDRLGHSTVRLTLELYTHSDLDLQRDAAQKLNDRFGRH